MAYGMSWEPSGVYGLSLGALEGIATLSNFQGSEVEVLGRLRHEKILRYYQGA